MKVTVVGTGYVGLVTGACLAEMGNHVVCLDVDAAQDRACSKPAASRSTSPGWTASSRATWPPGACSFTTDVERAVAHGTLQFIAVGTPPDEDGSADLQYVLAAARNIGRHMTDYKVVVDKSTVPVGTADKVRAAIAEALAQRGAAIDYSRGVEPRVPEGRRGGRRLHAARPHHRRRRRRAGHPADARAVRALPAQPRQAGGDGRALGRAHQVRRQRHAGHAHLAS